MLLAAPSRKLMDIVIEQNRRMAVLDDGHTSDAEREAITRLMDQVRAIRAGEEQPAAGLPLNLPAAYWRSTDTVDPVHEAQVAGLPMLVLQGARDIQVVDADWQGWKAGFLTPVPGGVGPMTIASLLRNTVRAARYQAGLLAFPGG